MTQDQIRFKNLSHRALKLLEANESAAKKIKRRLEDLEQDISFWEHQTDGLAVFASTDGGRVINLPLETDEFSTAGRGYFLVPLLGLAAELPDYYVLILSQKNPLLLRGDRYELRPSAIELPKSIKEALNIDEEFRKSVQFQSAQPGGGAMFHGHGAAKDHTGEDRLNYFRVIDRLLLEKSDRKLPLLIASAYSEAQEYREISRYPKLMKAYLNGDYPEYTHERLHSLVWPLVEAELLEPRRQQALEDLDRISGQGTGLASYDTNVIAEAATEGRVDRLLLGLVRRTQDTVEDNLGEVSKVIFKDAGQMEQLEDLALAIRNQGGEILLVEENRLPAGKVCAAIFRY